ncbi:MAG: hypothetical protein A2664_04895 [Candidatus Taylorbacteria bacterium RIFCSPHIGHO2_01_FULL_46_22b]|uniref:Uncharacterized protein n=1 Tax=Candidatus Taylorbacteria bacterium RIFCSPHIGHO2_01_FULL_46_22b TaxID=1802301 RepID=A0A1G2M4S8_9BACT|nr:MAG: hypothetical protein A2664_04895 [Candidatus Taylorbacteria bacterium RIFCSPHIGHO2_01_FULL_46_22b]
MVEKSGIMPASGRTTVKRSLISRIFRSIPFQFNSFMGKNRAKGDFCPRASTCVLACRNRSPIELFLERFREKKNQLGY